MALLRMAKSAGPWPIALALSLALAACALAQEPASPPQSAPANPAATEPAPAAQTPLPPLPDTPMPSNSRIDAVMSPTDSLAFTKTIADSASLLPVVEVHERTLAEAFSESSFGRSPLGRLYVKGGIFMWFLTIIAIYGVIMVLDRLWTVNRAQVNTRRLVGTVITTLKTEGVQAAAEECQKWRGPVAAVLYAGLQKADGGKEAVEKAISTAGMIEMSYLERRLPWISSVTTMAPLIGILGTATGMIRAFNAAAAGASSARVVASGLSEALMTTVIGLALAIPAALLYNYFVGRIDRLTQEMEEAAVELTDALRASR